MFSLEHPYGGLRFSWRWRPAQSTHSATFNFPPSYSGGRRFKSRQRARPPWLRYSPLTTVSPGHMTPLLISDKSLPINYSLPTVRQQEVWICWGLRKIIRTKYYSYMWDRHWARLPKLAKSPGIRAGNCIREKKNKHQIEPVSNRLIRNETPASRH